MYKKYKPVGFYGPVAPSGPPAERRAQLRVPNVPRSRISERDLFRIYEHAQCLDFERTCLQCAHFILAGRKWGRPLCYDWCLQQARAACGGLIALDGGVASSLALRR